MRCDQCDADEFHVVQGGDWVCSNGHQLNWTVVPDPDAAARPGPEGP
jgi:hypothetical protein